jgi:NAD(P)-dependent dehydrogenase (short-subunit alcohol dehydrogenase family)
MRKVALVTGGASGIGYGISEALARQDYHLAICGRRAAAQVKQSLDALRDLGAEVLYVSTDVADPDDRTRLLDAIRSHYGRLHLLVNNAGVAPRERNDLLDATEGSFDWVLGINLKGPYFLTQAAANWMIEQRTADPDFWGAIVNIGSISATMASTNRGEYCISKAGLAMATKLWAVRLGEHDIPVYEVRPGVTRSDMTSGVQEKYDRLIEEGLIVQPRWGTPDDVGKAVAMLGRGDLSYSTGAVLMVDGGITLSRL